jgi:6-phosphogluconolactonase
MTNRLARRDFLAGLAGCAAGRLGQGAPTKPALPAVMYVGGYTSGGRGHGEGISVYRRGPDAWALVQVLSELANPSFLAIDRRGGCLYSAHGDGTEVTAYRIDSATARLSVINRRPTGGRNAVHLAIDATNQFLVLANYASGTVVVLPINRDGSLEPVRDVATMTGTPGPHRTEQESSHPHHCPFDPTGRLVVVPDKGLDRVFAYRFDAASGRLTPGEPASQTARAGAAPRHVDFHPTRPFAYVVNELDSTITTYQLDPGRGVLKPLQIVPTLPETYTGNNTGAEIAVAPSGRFLYASNRGHDSIAIFAVDSRTATLSVVGWESTQGRTPRYFALDPPGTHLYAANQNSDTVVIFRIDQATGKLTPAGETIKVASPSTIVFR